MENPKVDLEGSQALAAAAGEEFKKIKPEHETTLVCDRSITNIAFVDAPNLV